MSFNSAVDYNTLKNGTLWTAKLLPWPLSAVLPTEVSFAMMVAAFQTAHGLIADGKLGPSTLSTMREVAKEGQPVPQADECFTPHTPTQPGQIPDRKCSNVLICSGQKVSCQALVTKGVTVSNYEDDDEHHFTKTYRYKKSIQHLVIHESGGGREAAKVVRTLERKGLGVHLIVAPDGHVSQHADLGKEKVIHANQVNATGVGVEVVNPYKATYIRPPFTRTIPAQWWTWVPKGAPRLYVTPTDAQLYSVRAIVPFVCERLGIPIQFPTSYLNAKDKRIPRWQSRAVPDPGVVAHRDFASHADGRFILEDLIAFVKGGRPHLDEIE